MYLLSSDSFVVEQSITDWEMSKNTDQSGALCFNRYFHSLCLGNIFYFSFMPLKLSVPLVMYT